MPSAVERVREILTDWWSVRERRSRDFEAQLQQRRTDEEPDKTIERATAEILLRRQKAILKRSGADKELTEVDMLLRERNELGPLTQNWLMDLTLREDGAGGISLWWLREIGEGEDVVMAGPIGVPTVRAKKITLVTFGVSVKAWAGGYGFSPDGKPEEEHPEDRVVIASVRNKTVIDGRGYMIDSKAERRGISSGWPEMTGDKSEWFPGKQSREEFSAVLANYVQRELTAFLR